MSRKRNRNVRLTDPGDEKEEKEEEQKEMENTWGDGSAGARRSCRARKPVALSEVVERYEEEKGEEEEEEKEREQEG